MAKGNCSLRCLRRIEVGYVGTEAPDVAVWIDQGTGTIAIEHICWRSVNFGPGRGGALEERVHVVNINVQSHRRAYAKGGRGFALVLRAFRTEHYDTVPPDNLGVHDFPIRAGHRHFLLKAKGLLVKGQGRIGILDCQIGHHPRVVSRLGRSLTHRCYSLMKRTGSNPQSGNIPSSVQMSMV